MNPFPNAPGTTDLGDGLRLVETHDRGHSYRVVEPDGKISVVIAVNNPPPATQTSDKPFHVRQSNSGQEIVSAQGGIVAKTTDPDMAKHICNLLVVWENLKKRNAGK